MSSPTAARRNAGAPTSTGVLGQLPRRTSGTGSVGDRPTSLNFGRSGSFGRLGATPPSSSPSSHPLHDSDPIGPASPGARGGIRPAGSRRLGTFNSLAAAAIAKPVTVAEVGEKEGEGQHPLDDEWTFWFMHRNPTRKTSEEEFNRSMKRVGSCQSVESFYSLYLHLRRPSALPPISDIHLFYHPVKPFWEDPVNARGGKWTIRLRKGIADRLWEGVVLGLVGGGIEKGTREGEGEGTDEEHEKEICGAVLSVRRDEDILAIWHRSGDAELAGDGERAKRIKATLQSLLSLPPSCQMTYKLHFR